MLLLHKSRRRDTVVFQHWSGREVPDDEVALLSLAMLIKKIELVNKSGTDGYFSAIPVKQACFTQSFHRKKQYTYFPLVG